MDLQDPVRARGVELRRLRGNGAFNSSLPPKTFAGFLAATVALFLISFLSYRSLESRSEASQRVTQTLEVTQQVTALMSSLKDAETGERGFLLTGADSFLEPYTAAVAALPGELAAARRAISNSVQQQRLDTLEELTKRKMEETAQSIDLKRSGKAAPGMALQRAERGRRLMDQIRALAAEMSET